MPGTGLKPGWSSRINRWSHPAISKWVTVNTDCMDPVDGLLSLSNLYDGVYAVSMVGLASVRTGSQLSHSSTSTGTRKQSTRDDAWSLCQRIGLRVGATATIRARGAFANQIVLIIKSLINPIQAIKHLSDSSVIGYLSCHKSGALHAVVEVVVETLVDAVNFRA